MEEWIKKSDAIKAFDECLETSECGTMLSGEKYLDRLKAIPSADRPQKAIAQITFDEEKLREIVKEAVERFKEEYEITDRPQGEWRNLDGEPVPLDEGGCPTESAWCSECGTWLAASDEYSVIGRFCPNCGADMRKGADDE